MHSPQKVILDKTAIIKQLGLFSDLSSGQINLIARLSEFYEYKRDEVIYNEGDAADAFYYLISGRVKIFTKGRGGETTPLEYLHRGSYFGIISLLTGEPHSVSAYVVNDAIVLKIQKEDFLKILKEVPRLAIHFSSTLSRRLKRNDLGQKTVFESTIISVYGVESNVGATLYAFNLAKALSRETKKDVALLDMGHISKAGVSKFLDIKTELPLLELMSVFFDEVRVKNSIFKDESGISILRIPYGPNLDAQKTQIIPLLSYLANIFDYCIVDLPSQTDGIISTVLAQSDLVHFVTDAEKRNIESANIFVKELENVIRQPQKKIKVIFNEAKGKFNDKAALNYGIYATLPDQTKNRQGYDLAIRRVARETGGALVGLALGSGGALGLTHIGVIKVLEKEGIPIDVIAGSSMGALIGAFWAVGYSGQYMEEACIENKKRLGLFTFKDLMLPVRGLISDVKTMYFLNKYLGERTFQEIRLPLKVVAAGLDDRKEIVMDSGKLVDAVRASIAIPGIYSPAKRKDAYLIDGGIIDPVPVGVLLKMKVRKIIAVNALPSPDDIDKGLAMAQEKIAKEQAELKNKNLYVRFLFKLKIKIISFFTPNIFDIIVNSMQAMEYSMAEASSKQADVAIHPNLAGWSWRDFLYPEELISLGEEACRKALPDIKRLIEEE